MYKITNVEYDKWRLNGKCKGCGKVLSYPIGSAMSFDQWKKKKKEFEAQQSV